MSIIIFPLLGFAAALLVRILSGDRSLGLVPATVLGLLGGFFAYLAITLVPVMTLNGSYPVIVLAPLLGGIFAWVGILLTGVTEISCQKCNVLTARGKRPIWQILCSIVFFPLGLLALLGGRNVTKCHKCGYTWQA